MLPGVTCSVRKLSQVHFFVSLNLQGEIYLIFSSSIEKHFIYLRQSKGKAHEVFREIFVPVIKLFDMHLLKFQNAQYKKCKRQRSAETIRLCIGNGILLCLDAGSQRAKRPSVRTKGK